MPFDNTTFVAVDEIAIVDRMMELLAEPEGWCKGQLSVTRPSGGQSYCLLGALNVVSSGNVMAIPHDKTSRATLAAMDRESGGIGRYAFVAFNNAPAATHADILMFLDAVRSSFIKEGDA